MTQTPSAGQDVAAGQPLTGAAPRIPPSLLRTWLGDQRELALIDVRDGGPFSRSHLLLAVNLPLAQFELRLPGLLPRLDVRIVLVDDDERLVDRAAAMLVSLGCQRVWALAGGNPAWAAAGYELFSGTNVPSKAFGEYVEHHFDTPRIDARTLAQWRAEGRDVVVVDSRPFEEFRMVSIPGASDCPGAELVMRLPAKLRSPETTVVVNCAGRTRSIIGTQSLRNAGLPNPIFALKDGTMGWQLAGFEPDHGATRMLEEPGAKGRERAQALAAEVARRHRVSFIDEAQLAAMLADASRSTYVFDVRLPEIFQSGHRPGSVNAPGGQLVQATDTFVAVRGARLVLVDDYQVQAVMTAHWLGQMGWRDVHVLRDGLAGPLETGVPRLSMLGEDRLTAPRWEPAQLQEAMAKGSIQILDVGDSLGWRRHSIPGSCFAMRSGLAQALARLRPDQSLVFVCADGRLSRHAAQDAIAMGWRSAAVLAGGRRAWQSLGLPMQACTVDEDPRMLTPTDDMWYPPWARASGVEEAMQQYLTWEVNLLDQLAREPYLRFGAPT